MLVAFSYRKSCTGSAHSSPSFGGIEGGLHLGNTVVMFEDKSGDNTVTNDEVIQRYYYYPFGAETKNAPWTQQPTPTVRYQYNGKEKIDELGLGWNDYGARNYDALLGRWMGVDALSEMYVGYSGYNYVLGNPIGLIDPDGMSVETCPTCPNTPDYDEARNSKSVFTYHKEEGILTNGDAEVEVKGERAATKSESRFYEYMRHYDYAGRKMQNSEGMTGLFLKFALGLDNTHSYALDDHPITQGLKVSYQVQKARDFFYKKYSSNTNVNSSRFKGASVTGYKGSFGLSGIWNAGFNGAEQFVGSMRIDIHTSDDLESLIFMVNDSKSATSLFYRLSPEWNREDARFFGNTYQTYFWSEKLIK